MPNFILLIREDLTRYPIAETELQSIIHQHVAWAKNLTERGLFISGNGMPETGNLVEKIANNVTVSPLRDLKEGIGGYYIIRANSYEEAIEIAKECPTFDQGDKIEVRILM